MKLKSLFKIMDPSHNRKINIYDKNGFEIAFLDYTEAALAIDEKEFSNYLIDLEKEGNRYKIDEVKDAVSLIKTYLNSKIDKEGIRHRAHINEYGVVLFDITVYLK